MDPGKMSVESTPVDVSGGGPAVPDVLDPVTQRHVDQAAARLADEFRGVFSERTIARYIAESLDLLGNSRINDFVPLLAHRFARERLRALAQMEGLMTKEAPEVLFVCVHNAGRSQMAAGLVKLRSEGRVHVRSAGSAPGDEINPAVVEAMTEIGVDMSEEFPKPLTPARSTLARSTRTGSLKTPTARTSPPFAASATRSTRASSA